MYSFNIYNYSLFPGLKVRHMSNARRKYFTRFKCINRYWNMLKGAWRLVTDLTTGF